VHLKSLTVKGFKSFAAATTLKLEPGITCVVGPNGSGKSNVVDAISWVLGEQGAKALRGGKMEDVIFAGTAGRAPLGRAEVTLTIDNHDGALPIEYTEVSITRRMYRSGESEYEINGDSCRLLDIQELLSDSGIGREMHVIVGQGQLDAVLHAKPEDRRAFIEEAAGVLKHRKRKEKALRKLDAMQVNLNRLTDLTAELRRQLKPLGRQAEVARRAAGIQMDLRDARLRLLADDLATLRETLDKEIADESALRTRRQEVEDGHRQELAPRPAVLADGRLVHGQEPQRVGVVDPHGRRVGVEQERVARPQHVPGRAGAGHVPRLGAGWLVRPGDEGAVGTGEGRRADLRARGRAAAPARTVPGARRRNSRERARTRPESPRGASRAPGGDRRPGRPRWSGRRGGVRDPGGARRCARPWW